MTYSKNELKEMGAAPYTIEGLKVIMDMGDFGRYVEYTAKDEAGLERWLIEGGRLMAENTKSISQSGNTLRKIWMLYIQIIRKNFFKKLLTNIRQIWYN